MIAHRLGSRMVFIYTDSTKVNGVTHELTFSAYSNAVAVGGRAANPTTAFYEDNGFAPIKAQVSGGNVLFFNGATQVYSLSLASLSSTNDYFVMEAFQDGGHTVIILWGINADGTLASGVYFDSVLSY